jgi:hypothetical protein
MCSGFVDALMAIHAGEGEVNERLLFHGSNLAALNSIMHEGFDISRSIMTGAQGPGVYFAWSSSYSKRYSAKARAGSGTRLM